jgi:hypothetical protein
VLYDAEASRTWREFWEECRKGLEPILLPVLRFLSRLLSKQVNK